MDIRPWLERAVAAVEGWQATFEPYTPHRALTIDDDQFGRALDAFAERLTDNYPYFHPAYAAQMLKPPHPAAVAGYVAAMLINPNNHALDSGPATARMEKEVIKDLATMFGFQTHLGHLTSSGTIANLEALFVARQTHPGKGVAYSGQAHYTHSRMCQLLGIAGFPIQTDERGRIDLDALEQQIKATKIGTVVLTAGTTGLGAVDQIHEALVLKDKYGVRLHVDAAYGGFFTLITDQIAPEPWRAIARCDSVVVDPHKHGLQPYGCGAVLFSDPGVGRFYAHDSPYTYFTSDDLHLGEISLECSRAGAAAAAFWLTLRLLPLTREGLGEVLAAGRRAATNWAARIEDSELLALYQQPELDIVTYFPRRARTLSEIDAASAQALADGMRAREPIFLSTLRVDAQDFHRRGHRTDGEESGARILRSVLMKPETELYVDLLHARVEQLL